MTLFNWLLAANWLEQKSQGDKTRAAMETAVLPPVNPVEVTQHLDKVRADPQSFSNWMSRQNLFTLMRMSLVGMTQREKAEALKAYQHECKIDFPR